jgi:hypothetical protein
VDDSSVISIGAGSMRQGKAWNGNATADLLVVPGSAGGPAAVQIYELDER